MKDTKKLNENRMMNAITNPMGYRSAASFLAAVIPPLGSAMDHPMVVNGRVVRVR